MRKLVSLVAASTLFFTACDSDDNKDAVQTSKFTVRVENIQAAKSFSNSGVTNAVPPGGTLSFSFNAGKGAYLSLATMFVQSNDLFYGFEETGLALYDANGLAKTGDVTSEITLWDAGTEVNQGPGVGADQPPRQAGANTGADENGTVKLITDVMDGYTYPANEEIIQIELAHDGGTEFTVTMNNVSDGYAFQTPLAPGVWAVHNSGMPIFTENQAAANGLEGLSEDGTNADLGMYLADNSGYVSPFAPGVFAISTSGKPFFTDGSADGGYGLEKLAEDGGPGDLNSYVANLATVEENGIFSMPVGQTGGAPIFPGDAYEFSFSATEGNYLNLASMLIQSNDLFVAFDDMGIALFNNGVPVTGDVSSMLKLWDAGTEANEYPGAGNNQPTRQAGPNTGDAETGTVVVVDDGYTYPAANEMIRVTIRVN